MNYRVNLLPEELQSEQPIISRRFFFSFLAVSFAAGLLTSYGLFLWDYYRVSLELTAFNEKLPQLEKKASSLEEIKRQRLDLEKKAGELEALIQNRRSWPGMLAEITKTVPEEVWLTSLRLEEIKEEQSLPEGRSAANPISQAPNGLTGGGSSGLSQGEGKEIKGKSLPAIAGPPNTLFIEGTSSSVPAVGLFTYRLGELPYFSKVVLTGLRSEGKEGYVAFTLVATLKAGKTGAK
ncbi:MAG: PilN domain-containing protein [Desulfotomaculales bacterium]